MSLRESQVSSAGGRYDNAYDEELNPLIGGMSNSNGNTASTSNHSQIHNSRSIQHSSRILIAAPGVQRQLSSSYNKYATIIVLLVSLPQILASVYILPSNWGNPILVCDADRELRWRIWSLMSTLRIIIFTILVVAIDILKAWLAMRPRNLNFVLQLKNVVDSFGLLWFIVGNIWLFGDKPCIHENESPIYNLCFSMIVINYLQIFLPCIMGLLMIPVFCFGMPCLIRRLARASRLSSSSGSEGAKESDISAIPTFELTSSNMSVIGVDDMSCSICLNDMVIGEVVKKVPCKHLFHKACLVEWLVINNSCPSCRQKPVS